MRLISSRSSINCACARALRSITAKPLVVVSLSFVLCKIWLQPSIALSGVLSSCDNVARNSSFNCATRSSSCLADCSRSSNISRSRSMVLRSVISTQEAAKPANSPPLICRGDAVSNSQRYSPSARRNLYSHENTLRC